MWDLSGPEIEPTSSALASGFLTTGGREVPVTHVLFMFYSLGTSLIFSTKVQIRSCRMLFFFLSISFSDSKSSVCYVFNLESKKARKEVTYTPLNFSITVRIYLSS